RLAPIRMTVKMTCIRERPPGRAHARRSPGEGGRVEPRNILPEVAGSSAAAHGFAAGRFHTWHSFLTLAYFSGVFPGFSGGGNGQDFVRRGLRVVVVSVLPKSF